MTRNGRALRVIELPSATPIRCRPKSKPSTTCSVIEEIGMDWKCDADARVVDTGSCMPGLPRQLRAIDDAEQLQRRGHASFGGCLEDDQRIGRHGEPRVVGDLLFELSGAPACV